MKKLLFFISFISCVVFGQEEFRVQDSIDLSQESLSYKFERKFKITDFNMIPAHLRNFAEPGYSTDLAYARDPNINSLDGDLTYSLADFYELYSHMGAYVEQTIKENEVKAYNKNFALKNTGTSYDRSNYNYTNSSNQTERVGVTSNYSSTNRNYETPSSKRVISISPKSTTYAKPTEYKLSK